MLKNKNKKTGIGNRIRNYMKNVTVDVFGYEKIVTDNITNYFKEVAEKYDVEPSSINVRICKKPNLTAHVYNGNVIAEIATTPELINFFMGKGSNELFDLEKKVETNVSNYLSDYAAVTGIQANNVVINISKPAQEVMVIAYHNSRFIEVLELSGLIKYFNV